MSKPTEEVQQEAIRPIEPPTRLGKRLQDRFAEVATAEFVVPTRHTPRAPLQREIVNPWTDPAHLEVTKI